MFQQFLVVPDSFKGTLSALEVASIMTSTLQERFPHTKIHAIPVADGGEGSVDAFLAAMPGTRIEVQAQDPYGRTIDSYYGMLEGKVAVIEMAAAAGLPLVGEERHAEKTSTYGVGELILHAASQGATKIIMGLGGSATNDGGCGAACACGVRFFNAQQESFVPVGETLHLIDRIDVSGLDPRLAAIEFETMCDIDNPLCGPTGASAVFGPQKGATPEQVTMLDAGLAHLSCIIERDLGVQVLNIPGAGAAGGMGAGMVAFFGSPLKMGIECVLDTVGFDELLEQSDMVFSGEGCFDGQSLHGKVVVGVGHRCRKAHKPLYAVAGVIDDTVVPAAQAQGVGHLVCINRTGVPLEVAMRHPRSNLAHTMGQLSELIASAIPLPGRIRLQDEPFRSVIAKGALAQETKTAALPVLGKGVYDKKFCRLDDAHLTQASCDTSDLPGVFISFEGMDGAGKSTHISLLADLLRKSGHEVVCVREPSIDSLESAFNQAGLISSGTVLSDLSEMLLLESARAELIDSVIAPALNRGAVVLCDRFAASEFAYQVYGKGLQAGDVAAAQAVSMRSFLPQRSLLLLTDFQESLQRATCTSARDLPEEVGQEFHERISQALLHMAEQDPDHYVLIPTDQSIDEAAAAIRTALCDIFPEFVAGT